jgi:hypothetical protein
MQLKKLDWAPVLDQSLNILLDKDVDNYLHQNYCDISSALES